MKGTLKSFQYKFFISFYILIFTLALINGTTGIANKDENLPVLGVDIITDISVRLNWDLGKCDLDCNTYHLRNFESWELYQKKYLDLNYFLVFSTPQLWETSTTVTGLEANSQYFFYVKLYWDWSNLNPDITSTYGKNYTSDPIFVQTLNPGETKILTNYESDNRISIDSEMKTESSLGESLPLFPSIISLLVVVSVVSFSLVILKRKMSN